ncbi:MAG TPA: hypothetical protein DEQ26_12990, partial [Flavobacteriaceae bacterium]|nr:hypothetical protein [Flavobacteriaceae bacterium]
ARPVPVLSKFITATWFASGGEGVVVICALVKDITIKSIKIDRMFFMFCVVLEKKPLKNVIEF